MAVIASSGSASVRSAATTARARSSLNRWFPASEPCESVCPPTSKAASGQPSSASDSRSMVGRLSAVIVAEPAANWIDAPPRMEATSAAQVADNDTEEGRAANRRIAFTLPGLAAAAEAGAEAEAEAGAEARADTEATGSGDEESLVAQSQSGDPTEVCLARLDAILSENTIEFAPGSATITPESAPVVNAIAGVLRGCPDATLEVGGHTDSSGSDSGNLALSQQRADAVLAAVRRSDLPLPGLAAKGYGEGQPLGDNGAAEGRAQNRRIAFTAGTGEGTANEDGSGDADGSE